MKCRNSKDLTVFSCLISDEARQVEELTLFSFLAFEKARHSEYRLRHREDREVEHVDHDTGKADENGETGNDGDGSFPVL